jgi:hypothetical protein
VRNTRQKVHQIITFHNTGKLYLLISLETQNINPLNKGRLIFTTHLDSDMVKWIEKNASELLHDEFSRQVAIK